MKNQDEVCIFQIIAFEFVAGNSPYCDENTCSGQSMW